MVGSMIDWMVVVWIWIGVGEQIYFVVGSGLVEVVICVIGQSIFDDISFVDMEIYVLSGGEEVIVEVVVVVECVGWEFRGMVMYNDIVMVVGFVYVVVCNVVGFKVELMESDKLVYVQKRLNK